MGVSVPGMPDAGALSASDWLYILQGTGLDRDRKATLSKVREYCTSAGVALHELNTSNAVSSVLTLALGAATTNAFVVVSGTVCSTFTLSITGSVPAGCQVNVLMEASGSLKIVSGDGATVNGIDATLLLSLGDSSLLGRGTGTVWWGSATRSAANTDAAVLAETQRAEGVETSFSQSLSSEANARSEADTALGTRITTEESAREQAIAACATTAGDNSFSGENSFTKTLGFSVASFGSDDASSIPMESLSKGSPAVFKLTGYGIIYCDFLTPGYSPVRCTVINSVNKGLSISGLSGTIRKIFQNGTHLDIAVVHDSMTGISDLAVELIWDGSVLNVVSLAEYKPSNSIGMSATIGEPGDLPRVLRTTGSNDHSVSLADPTLCDGYSCTILRGDAGTLALSWSFTGTFPVLCWAKGGSSWVTHATGFSASSSALLIEVYSSGGEWWIRES